MDKKLNFINESKILNDNTIDYSKVDYKGCCTKVELICKKEKHGSFWQTPNNHISKGQKCPKCKFEKLSKDRKDTTESIKLKFIKKHKKLWDYSRLVYVDSNTKVEIGCDLHGWFWMLPTMHTQGQGCEKCGIIKRSDKLRTNKEDLINNLTDKYVELLDFSKSKYVDLYTNIEVICDKHGKFLQKPYLLLKSNGCKKCIQENKKYWNKISERDSIEIANKVHDFKYKYDDIKFNKVTDKVVIECKKHGKYKQIWHEHYKYGKGCPKCVHHISKPEIQIQDFLKNLNIEIQTNKRGIIGRKELDIHIPELKKAIEFNGLYWHYSDKYFVPGKHAHKSNLCREKGIQLLHIREDLWKKDPEKMKLIIEKFINKN